MALVIHHLTIDAATPRFILWMMIATAFIPTLAAAEHCSGGGIF